jgi:hypothetical protein
VIYDDSGWVNYRDWLGVPWRPFDEARAYVHGLGLKKQTDWNAWSKTGARPADIPSNPDDVYKDQGWISWGNWLGTGALGKQNRVWRSFEEARAFARGLGLTNVSEWMAWAKSPARPPDIPTNPQNVYKESSWAGFGDWLGTGNISNRMRLFRPFEEARAYVRGIGLKNQTEWNAWARSDARPADIPSNAHQVYRDEGWAGYSDWLGVINHWSRNEIVSFLRDLLPRLPGLSPMVLFEIFRRNGMLTAAKERTNGNRQLLAEIATLSRIGDHSGLAERIAAILTPSPSDSATPESSAAQDEEITATVSPPHNGSMTHDAVAALDESVLPTFDMPAVLGAVDYAALVCPGADEEAHSNSL